MEATIDAMTLENFEKAFLTGTHHRCKNQSRCFPAHFGGKNVKLFIG